MIGYRIGRPKRYAAPVPTDAELLASWASGDDRAGKALLERHYVATFRFFRAKVDAEIDDLVQQTFLGLLESRGGWRGDSSFRSYLFGIARNVLRHHYRRRGRKEGRIDFGTHSVIDLGASPSAFLAEKGERRLLLEALRRLAVDDQIVIELYHWEGLSGPELALVLELTEPAVRSRLHRAKARLAKAMEEIARSEGMLQSTLTSFDEWAVRVRELLDVEAPPAE
jgi:RNA polymerase sigma factor (sigma-70 family)